MAIGDITFELLNTVVMVSSTVGCCKKIYFYPDRSDVTSEEARNKQLEPIPGHSGTTVKDKKSIAGSPIHEITVEKVSQNSPIDENKQETYLLRSPQHTDHVCEGRVLRPRLLSWLPEKRVDQLVDFFSV